MLIFLIDRLIGSRNISKKSNRDKLIKLTGLMGLVINLSLSIMKILIGLISGSIAIISDSINNLSDCLTSLVTIYGSKLAAKPADEDHPYGHGRSEYLASILVGLFIFVIGIRLFFDSIDSIMNPGTIKASYITFAILIISILLKVYMYSYNRKVAQMADSILNKSVAKDSLNDVIATSLVLVSMIINRYFAINIDGYVGLAISVLVVKSAVDIFIEISDVLMGKQVDQDLKYKMVAIILRGKYIEGVHKIELHEYGKNQLFGSCHADVPANIDVYSMHSIVNKVEEEVMDELGIALTIHVDPNYLLDQDHFKRIEDESLLEDIDR